eukprot:scaffold3069_cov215-Amphora_coffeaeformis.AAC.7
MAKAKLPMLSYVHAEIPWRSCDGDSSDESRSRSLTTTILCSSVSDSHLICSLQSPRPSFLLLFKATTISSPNASNSRSFHRLVL